MVSVRGFAEDDQLVATVSQLHGVKHIKSENLLVRLPAYRALP